MPPPSALESDKSFWALCNYMAASRFKVIVDQSRNAERPILKAVFILTYLFLCSYVAFAQTEANVPKAGVEEVYLAKDDGEGKAGEQVTEFRTTDIPIHCVVLLDSAAKATVKMNFVAVSVSGVKAETKVVTASYTTKDGQNRVNFTGRPDGRWTPGKYRVDIFVDGKMATNLEFDIRASSSNMAAAKFLPPVEPPKPKPRQRKN